jgi:hypothetical protein
MKREGERLKTCTVGRSGTHARCANGAECPRLVALRRIATRAATATVQSWCTECKTVVRVTLGKNQRG